MSNETNYQLTLTLPTPDEFCALRKAAGLSPRSLAAATRGLPNSLMGVSIRKQGQLVAMARVVGDGSIVFEVVDVAVTPSEQGHGLGKQLMHAVTNYLSEHAPADADVSLIADVPADHLYAQFSFQPTAPESIGMAWHRE